MIKNLTCGFVGLGLIGGSIAKALKAADASVTILAMDPNRESLALAASELVVDQVFHEIDESFGVCDYLFLCAPVSCNSERLVQLKKYLSPDCILTDVGSVKSGINETIEALDLAARFIGGHPMAGSERFGYLNAKAKLLENAYYILTPTSQVPKPKVDALRSLVASMGAIPLILDAARHDYVTAAVSHLPHVIASSLVNLVRDSDSADGVMKMIAAGGFRDITRIASSSPAMWQQICLTNTENISALLGDYIDSLLTVKIRLDAQNEDALYSFFDDARAYRESFIEASSGPIKKAYAITVDIADETGALASIATILALKQISIKNIGIVHNRELEEGVLRIEFYEEAAITQAKTILKSRGYTIYEKK